MTDDFKELYIQKAKEAFAPGGAGYKLARMIDLRVAIDNPQHFTARQIAILALAAGVSASGDMKP
jgi:hypothetical protein